MNWCSIDETYVNYLKSYESRIPYSDYGVNHFKPFFRPLFEIEPGIIFVGAISHPQDRHRKMKNKRILGKYLYRFMEEMEELKNILRELFI
ncbi:type III toxin-antitoxin system ToxN/AbiQ family toxin [Lactobacillus helveticus]|uniref:type III toxin-antitoxin system ToxN/AbiQ family toxin n=1 Tax=Lactobacillus helveticus TaxID=1587 RepID=UPI0019EDC0D8|nr:type III toxin-antitoxin system ToxN/AbiQ family toxin [Lactobacillus helveticus]MCO0806468.1 type III toxin-antitoxin system ToxN/AbiQ family toxin [Lactobacillus helveticus]MDH5817020.1 type III toxin-antitoxin system ToxN/AbiQ family toxin [Lactobacillus helveticus]NRO75351.1 hypothetical protein [Lactobacillus helveticus]